MANIMTGYKDQGIPHDTPLTRQQLKQMRMLRRAVSHLAVELRHTTVLERPGVWARTCERKLLRQLIRIAKALPAAGAIYIRDIAQSDTRLSCEIWYVENSYVRWEITLYMHLHQTGIEWRTPHDPVFRSCKRTDTLIRKIYAAKEKERQAKAARIAVEDAKYIQSLPPDLAALQLTAKPHCIQVHANGSITEHWHDVGGSCTDVPGTNAYVLPQSLADQQAAHDAIYHSGR